MKTSMQFCGFWLLIICCVLHTNSIRAQPNMQPLLDTQKVRLKIIPPNALVASHFKYKIGAQIQVLNQGQPLENIRVMFSRSVAGLAGTPWWADPTDASGRAFVEIGVKHSSDSGYYTALATDLQGREIGRWHSIPLVAGQLSVLRLEVGKSFDRVTTVPLYAFDVALDSAKTVVDSVIAGVYLPLQIKALSFRYVNGIGAWRVDESYQGAEIGASVRAGDQDIDGVHWRGEGVTDLGEGRAILNGGWKNGQRQIEVMSTRVLDDFSVFVEAFGGRGKLSGLTVDNGDVTQYIVRALEDGVETTEVIGEFEVDVRPTDSGGNLSAKFYSGSRQVDSLTLSLEMLDSRIKPSDVLSELFIDFAANMGDALVPSGPQILPANGARFVAVAPDRDGSGFVMSVRTANVAGDTAASYSSLPRYVSAHGATPPLTFLPEKPLPEPQVGPPEAPANFVVQDYKGASGAGDEGGYLIVSFPISIDHESLSAYRVDRELQVTTEIDDAGNVILLEVPARKWVPWVTLDPIDNGFDVVRAVIPVTDNQATRWAIAAERKDSNGLIASSGRTVADGFVAAIDNIPPTAVANVKWSFIDGAMRVSWDVSKDDRTVGYINYQDFAIPIAGVASYEVFRVVGNDLVFLDTLPSGSTTYIDENVSLDDINQVRYRVDALDMDNRTVESIAIVNGTKRADLSQSVFVRSFGSQKGDSHYRPDADIDGDGVVGFTDFLLYLEAFGEDR